MSLRLETPPVLTTPSSHCSCLSSIRCRQKQQTKRLPSSSPEENCRFRRTLCRRHCRRHCLCCKGVTSPAVSCAMSCRHRSSRLKCFPAPPPYVCRCMRSLEEAPLRWRRRGWCARRKRAVTALVSFSVARRVDDCYGGCGGAAVGSIPRSRSAVVTLLLHPSAPSTHPHYRRPQMNFLSTTLPLFPHHLEMMMTVVVISTATTYPGRTPIQAGCCCYWTLPSINSHRLTHPPLFAVVSLLAAGDGDSGYLANRHALLQLPQGPTPSGCSRAFERPPRPRTHRDCSAAVPVA